MGPTGRGGRDPTVAGRRRPGIWLRSRPRASASLPRQRPHATRPTCSHPPPREPALEADQPEAEALRDRFSKETMIGFLRRFVPEVFRPEGADGMDPADWWKRGGGPPEFEG